MCQYQDNDLSPRQTVFITLHNAILLTRLYKMQSYVFSLNGKENFNQVGVYVNGCKEP